MASARSSPTSSTKATSFSTEWFRSPRAGDLRGVRLGSVVARCFIGTIRPAMGRTRLAGVAHGRMMRRLLTALFTAWFVVAAFVVGGPPRAGATTIVVIDEAQYRQALASPSSDPSGPHTS